MRESTLVTLLLLALTAPLGAQETRGQITGHVQDSSQAVVVGAEIRATNTATNVSYTAKTNETGDYLISYLLPGTYTITVSLTGFREYVRENVAIRVADRMMVNVVLEPGQVTERVVVNASAPLLEQASASLSQVIDDRRIAELPLREGNPMLLTSTVPGVLSFTGTAATDPSAVIGSSSFSINGTRTFNNDFTLDGVANTQRNIVGYVPPVEAVQEVRVQTASFDASQGFTPGGVINVSLKSGTNKLHGSAYEFFQNNVLNANRFFSNLAGLKKPPLRFNRWGANANGPVRIPGLYDGRNRTFWMYTYEDSRRRSPRGTYTSTVPTEAEKAGDFSALLKLGPQYQLYDPLTTRPAPGGRFERQPFPGNIIPANRIHPTAKKLSALWAAPNLPGTIDGSQNYTDPGPESINYVSHLFRVDHQFSDRHRIYVRGDIGNRDQQYDVRFQRAQGAEFRRFMRGFAIDDVYTFSPRLVANVRYGLTRFTEQNIPLQGEFDLASLGFSKAFIDEVRLGPPRSLKLPHITVAGYAPLGNQSVGDRRNEVHSLAGSLTHLVRSHNFRYGAEHRVYRENTYGLGNSSGILNFGAYLNGPLDNSPGAPKGPGLAAFLLGIPGGGNIVSNDSYAVQSAETGLYLQDDWRLSPRLTVSLGLRYELSGPLTERFNRTVRGFDFNTPNPIEAAARANYALRPIPEVPLDRFRVTGGLTFASPDERALFNRDANNFMPRVGFAYSLNSGTVLRGGYGIFFDQLNLTRFGGLNQSGFSRVTQLVPTLDNGQTYIASLDNPFPSGFQRAAATASGLSTFVGQGVGFYNENLVNPYMQRWQISLQRELMRQTVLEVAYVGNRGAKLRIGRQANPIPRNYLSTSPVRDQATIDYLSAQAPNPFFPLLPGTGLSGNTIARNQLLRQYPQFFGIGFDFNEGYSWYHSMQTRLEKRFSGGSTVNVSWTWSKFMEATGYLNETDPMPERVISDLDRTHRVVLSGVYELPFGRGRRWGANLPAAINRVVEGWQISTLYQYQSGAPLGFGNAIFTGDLGQIPLPASQRTISRWFNTGAGFETDIRKQLGFNIRTIPSRFSGIRGDVQNNWDFSVVKITDLGERLKLHFRTEFINAFNHVQFGNPNTGPGSTAFGTVTSETSLPRTIQFALRLVF